MDRRAIPTRRPSQLPSQLPSRVTGSRAKALGGWFAPFALAAWAQDPAPVGGLRPGESARVEQGLVAPGTRAAVRGRVLDAVNGRPIAGASIELWPEGWKVPHGALGAGVTLADGSFCVPHPAEIHPEKLVVLATGYRATTFPRSEADEILLWPRTRALGLRVLDLEGRPIAGAHAQTRQTCAHAKPAWVGTSGADGRFDTSDFPPFEDDPELVIQAPGHGAVFHSEAEPLLDAGGFDVRLPRRAPIAFRVVDSEGRPMARRRISLGGEPEWNASTTDEAGRVQFDSPFFDRVAMLRIEDDHQEQPLLGGRIPIGFEPRLVYAPDADDPPEVFPLELVDRNGPVTDARVASIGELFTELEAAPANALRSDQGPTILVAGGPFSGWNEKVVRLGEPAPTRMVLEREPRLTIETPAGTWKLHVQCAEDSVTVDNFDKSGGSAVIAVPAGGPLLVCAVGEADTRLVRLARVDADATVDLRPDACVIARRPAPRTPVRLTIDTGGVAARARIRTGRQDLSFEGDEHGLALEFDPTAPFEGRVSAEGCVPRGLIPGLTPLDPSRPLKLTLARRAALLIDGPLRGFVAGGQEATPVEAAEDAPALPGWIVEDLAPGPLVADVQLEDGRVLRMSLELLDGERRRLTVR